MTAAYLDGDHKGPRSIGELTRMVEENAISGLTALGMAYALGHAAGLEEKSELDTARVVRVGSDGTHTPEVTT
jgi:hypothetical protein